MAVLAPFKVGLAQLWRSFQNGARFSPKIGAVRANLRHMAMEGKRPAVMQHPISHPFILNMARF